jgi:hypothetical protein
MNSIETYLESIAFFEEKKKPFNQQIEEIEDRISTIEDEMEELECELLELENDRDSQVEELEKIMQLQKKAYQVSLNDPKSIIRENLKINLQHGIIEHLKLRFDDTDSLVVVTIPFKRLIVKIIFPEIATALDQYGPLLLVIEPRESTQPWQIKKTIKLMKQHQFLGNLKLIGNNKYLLPATLDTQSDVVVKRLSILSTIAAELDAPMTYEYNPKELV